MKKNILFFILIILIQNTFSQEFNWRATVEKIDSSGFYNIYLNPDVTSRLRYELPDIRLFDNHNTEIPYILRLDRKHNYSKKLKKLDIIKNKYFIRKGLRQILVENKRKEEISNLILNFEKTNAIITAKIIGSNNKKDWYILKNSSVFHVETKKEKQAEIIIEDLPLTNFKFFKIEISSNNKEKLFVKKVFYKQHLHSEQNFMQLVSPFFSQDNTTIKGKSIITIKFKQPEFIDKMRFRFRETNYFLRKANLLKIDSVGEKKFHLQQYDRKKFQFVLNSTTNNEFFFTNFKAQQLRFEIENQDDAPLELISVRAFQQNAYLIAHLEANKDYYILFGSSRTASPLYDLNYFTDSIPLELTKVEVGKVAINQDKLYNKTKIKIPIYFLWSITIGLAAFLAFMVFKMFKKMNL